MVGLGRMAQALLLPLLAAGRLDAQEVRAVVASEASARQLAGVHGLEVGTDPAAAWRCPTVLLAVKPQQLEAVAAGAPAWESLEPPLLISVLAGVSLARLARLFPGRRIVRAVPNTPALVGAGLTALAFGEGVGEPRTRVSPRPCHVTGKGTASPGQGQTLSFRNRWPSVVWSIMST